MYHKALDWSFHPWRETTIPSSGLLIDDQAVPNVVVEELVVICNVQDTIVNLLPDIDGTTGAISGTNKVVLETTNVDHNSSVSIGTKVIIVLTQFMGHVIIQTRNQQYVLFYMLQRKHVQHGTDAVLKEPPAKQPPPEPLLSKPLPTGATAICTTTFMYWETMSINEEKQFLPLLNDLFF